MVINDVARTGHVRRRPEIARDLHAIAEALLDQAAHSDTSNS